MQQEAADWLKVSPVITVESDTGGLANGREGGGGGGGMRKKEGQAYSLLTCPDLSLATKSLMA